MDSINEKETYPELEWVLWFHRLSEKKLDCGKSIAELTSYGLHPCFSTVRKEHYLEYFLEGAGLTRQHNDCISQASLLFPFSQLLRNRNLFESFRYTK